MRNDRGPNELSRAQIIQSIAASVAFVGYGGYLAAKTANDVTATCCVSIGALFALIAVVRRVPRLRFGNAEMDPSPAHALQTGVEVATLLAVEAAQHASSPASVAEEIREHNASFQRSDVLSRDIQIYAHALGGDPVSDAAYDSVAMSATGAFVPAISSELIDEAERLLPTWKDSHGNIFVQAHLNIVKRRELERQIRIADELHDEQHLRKVIEARGYREVEAIYQEVLRLRLERHPTGDDITTAAKRVRERGTRGRRDQSG